MSTLMSTSNPSPGAAGGTPARVVTLSQLTPGQTGVICEGGLDAKDAEVLRAMGLRPGGRVRLCRPGQPCIVEVSDGVGCVCRIGMAQPLAERVMIRLTV